VPDEWRQTDRSTGTEGEVRTREQSLPCPILLVRHVTSAVWRASSWSTCQLAAARHPQRGHRGRRTERTTNPGRLETSDCWCCCVLTVVDWRFRFHRVTPVAR
jgi:hypothetical protein